MRKKMDKKLQQMQKEVNNLKEICTKMEAKEEVEKKCGRLEGRCQVMEVDGKNLRRQVDGLWKRSKDIMEEHRQTRNIMEEKWGNDVLKLQRKIEDLEEKYKRMEDTKKSEIEELNEKLKEEKEKAKKVRTETNKDRKDMEERLAYLEKLVGINQNKPSTAMSSPEPTSSEVTIIQPRTFGKGLPKSPNISVSGAASAATPTPPITLPPDTLLPKIKHAPNLVSSPIIQNPEKTQDFSNSSNIPANPEEKLFLQLFQNTNISRNRSKSPRDSSKAKPLPKKSRLDANTALNQAAAEGDFKNVQRLLASGADANARNMYGYTALQMASKLGHANVAAALLAAGAEVNRTSDGGLSPLHSASINGHVSVVALLLKSKACVNSKTTFDETPLHCAAGNGRLIAVQHLLCAGADATAVNHRGQTPFHMAKTEEIRRILKRAMC